MACSAHDSVLTQNRIPPTASAREDLTLAKKALSGSMTMRPLRKDTNTSRDSSSNHIDSNLGTGDINRLDTNCTKDSEFGDVRELETIAHIRSDDELLGAEEQSYSFGASASNHGNDGASTVAPTIEYKVYRRRYFGLFQLALLNIIVSWDVSNIFNFFPAGYHLDKGSQAKNQLVVIICSEFDHYLPILRRLCICRKLVQYFLPIRFRCYQSPHYVDFK